MKAPWLIEAEKHIGQREVPGPGSSAWIRSLWQGLKGGQWFWDAIGKGDDSKLPWCGAFVAYCMQATSNPYATKYASAKAWLDWGIELSGPAVGAVVVFSRDGGGHVGFVTGRDTLGRLTVLGGNQGNAVSIAPFDHARVVGYRWPRDVPQQPDVGFDRLPITPAEGPLSSNEA